MTMFPPHLLIRLNVFVIREKSSSSSNGVIFSVAVGRVKGCSGFSNVAVISVWSGVSWNDIEKSTMKYENNKTKINIIFLFSTIITYLSTLNLRRLLLLETTCVKKYLKSIFLCCRFDCCYILHRRLRSSFYIVPAKSFSRRSKRLKTKL